VNFVFKNVCILHGQSGVSVSWGVVLLAEMLSVLVLALVMDREAHPLGMSINWAKTKIQNLGDHDGANQTQYTTV